MRVKRRIGLSIAVLLSVMVLTLRGFESPTHAGVMFELSELGLTKLEYQGVNIVQNTDPSNAGLRANWVAFQNRDGSVTQGDCQPTQTTLDTTRNRLTLDYTWGRIVTTFTAVADQLKMKVQIINQENAAIRSVSFQPVRFEFPTQPTHIDGVVWDGNPYYKHNIGSPSILPVVVGNINMAIVNDDVKSPLLLGTPGSRGDRQANTTYPLYTATGSDGPLPGNMPTINRLIAANSSQTYNLSLRFAPSGTLIEQITDDIRKQVVRHAPFILKWNDSRPINQLVLPSMGSYENNPRGWFHDPNLNVNTVEGKAELKKRFMDYADAAITQSKRLNAQAVVLWNIEGNQYPEATYIGDPRVIQPELKGFINEFFAKFRKAGLKIGFTLRPTQYVMTPDGGRQVDVSDPVSELNAKIKYARQHFGAKLFYVDSNIVNQIAMDADQFRRLAVKYRDTLFIPEHQTLEYASFAASYTELRSGVTSTPQWVLDYYPKAKSVIRVSDGDLLGHFDELVAAVRRGDILLFQGWFPSEDNELVKQIYDAAKLPAGLPVASPVVMSTALPMSPQAVPEPGTLVLVGLGLMLMMTRRKARV